MGQPLTTDNIGPYLSDAFVEAFNDVCLPAFNSIAKDIDTLKIDMKDVKNRLGNVEERLGSVEEDLKEVKDDMATKEDLKKLEITLTKRMDRMSDVQTNLNDRVEALESESPIKFA